MKLRENLQMQYKYWVTFTEYEHRSKELTYLLVHHVYWKHHVVTRFDMNQ